ncbi:uncharacterized protein [Procambarus clarkii]|uniref:uncharacterized protein n=1 Tax=Procambarus clarkii TaxID=6728 RepID=UPI00374213D4
MYEGPATACTYQNPLELKRGLLANNLHNKSQGLALGGSSAMMTSPLNIKSEEMVAPDWSACTYRFPGLTSCGGVDPLKAVTSMGVRGDDAKMGGYPTSLLPHLRHHPDLGANEHPAVISSGVTSAVSASGGGGGGGGGLALPAAATTPDGRDTPLDHKPSGESSIMEVYTVGLLYYGAPIHWGHPPRPQAFR